MKKIISIAIILIAGFAVLSFLPDKQPVEVGGTGGINNSSQSDIAEAEIKKYDIYNPDLTGLDNSKSTVDGLLKKAHLTEETDNGVSIYESESLEDILMLCDNITEIAKINDMLYISYFATDGNDITLTFDNDGLLSKDIYIMETDTFIMIHRDYAYMVNNFRHG